MKHPASLSLISLGLAASATAIDLTPQIVTLVVGDYAVRRACFADGDKKYAVTVDSETELTGSGGTALFNFSKFPRAVMRLAPSPLKPQIVFAGETLERYRATLLLQGAEPPVLEKEDADVLPVNQWTSRRFTFAYNFLGAPMRESVTFLNLDRKQQIVMQTRARQADFALISARGDDILRRWHDFRPEEATEGN